MREFGLIFFILLVTILPCNASIDDLAFNVRVAGEKVIFTYHIPDDEDKVSDVNINKSNDIESVDSEIQQDIVSDDVTADTSGIPYYDADNQDYEIDDMYSDVLYGYAQYVDDEEGIFLDDIDYKAASLNISNPLKVKETNYNLLKLGQSFLTNNQFSKYNIPEYSISTIYNTHQGSFGKGFSAGTTYWQGISDGELEQSSGLFSKYQYKNLAFTTTYTKTINSTNNDYSDNLFFTPELNLNQYLTIKEILSTNIVNRVKKAEFMISLNPFGKKDQDRLRFNISAVQSYDDNNNLLKNQFKFYTNYRF